MKTPACPTGAAPWTNTEKRANPNRRGQVRVAANRRHFEYADGTLFFILADTLWAGNTARCGLGTNEDGPFFPYLADRQAKGFNIVTRLAANRVLEPAVPVFCSEAYYERATDPDTAYHLRWQLWTALLSGPAGFGYGARSIWQFLDLSDPQGETGKRVTAEMLERLGFFLAELKKRGIYVYLDLLDCRRFLPADSVRDAEQLQEPWQNSIKGASTCNERMIEFQKEYAGQFLTYHNSHAGLRLVDDPTVAVVEITNENSVFYTHSTSLMLPSYADEPRSRCAPAAFGRLAESLVRSRNPSAFRSGASRLPVELAWDAFQTPTSVVGQPKTCTSRDWSVYCDTPASKAGAQGIQGMPALRTITVYPTNSA